MVHVPFISSKLPEYAGPYPVGIFDMELPLLPEDKRKFATFTIPSKVSSDETSFIPSSSFFAGNSQPKASFFANKDSNSGANTPKPLKEAAPLELETVLFSVFYPAEDDIAKTATSSGHAAFENKTRRRSSLGSMLSSALSATQTALPNLPNISPFAMHHAPSSSSKVSSSGESSPRRPTFKSGQSTPQDPLRSRSRSSTITGLLNNATSAISSAALAHKPNFNFPNFSGFQMGLGSPVSVNKAETLKEPLEGRESHQSDVRKSRRVKWMPRPFAATIHGYARFAESNPTVAFLLAHSLARSTKIPAIISMPIRKGTKWKTIIFSHGLAGTRRMYSTMCGNLASQGYIVIAIEHRDGSGPCSFVYPSLEEQSDSGHQNQPKLVNWIDWKEILWPHESATKQESHVALREEQLLMRVAEIEIVVRYFSSMVRDGHSQNCPQFTDLRQGDKGCAQFSSSQWKDWSSCVDMEHPILIGHSFGGQTVINASLSPILQHCQRVIVLDVWCYWAVFPKAAVPIIYQRPDCAKPSERTPLLLINSEDFERWHGHYRNVLYVAHDLKARGGRVFTYGIVGANHASWSDMNLLTPTIAKLAGSPDPEDVILRSVKLVKEFVEVNEDYLLPPIVRHASRMSIDQESFMYDDEVDLKIESQHNILTKYLNLYSHLKSNFQLSSVQGRLTATEDPSCSNSNLTDDSDNPAEKNNQLRAYKVVRYTNLSGLSSSQLGSPAEVIRQPVPGPEFDTSWMSELSDSMIFPGTSLKRKK